MLHATVKLFFPTAILENGMSWKGIEVEWKFLLLTLLLTSMVVFKIDSKHESVQE